MVQDDWKDHVDRHRSDFDTYELEDGVWIDLESRLIQAEQKENKKVISFSWVWKATAACVSALVIAFFLYPTEENGVEYVADSELTEVENYYQDKINVKVSQISAIEKDEDIFKDLKVLDQAFVELKEDLKDNADNEEVINAMIATYKVKLEVLERILEELEEKKSKVDA